MEKTALIQEFKNRVGEDDAKVISDRTFDAVAETALSLFADDSKITEETWKFPVDMLKQYAGQKRHDDNDFANGYKQKFEQDHESDVLKRIEAAKTEAIEAYKKEHPENTGGGGAGGDDINEKVNAAIEEKFKTLLGKDSEFGKLSANMTAFLESQKNREKTETKNQVKAGLISYLTGLESTARKGGELPAEIKNLIEDSATYLEYGDEPNLEDLKPKIKAFYEREYKRRYPNGGQPFQGESSGGGAGGNNFVQKRVDELKKEAQDNQNYAAELEKGFV